MSEYALYNDELKHYGVLGMKWGIHRKGAANTYAKALKKKTAAEERSEKLKKVSDDYRNAAKTEAKTYATLLSNTSKMRKQMEEREQFRSDMAKKDITNMSSRELMTHQKSLQNLQKIADDAKKRYESAGVEIENAKRRTQTYADESRRYATASASYQRKAQRLTRSMNKAFKDIDQSEIDAGRAIFDEWYKNRKKRK